MFSRGVSYVAQAGFELLTLLSYLLQAGITGMSCHAWPLIIFIETGALFTFLMCLAVPWLSPGCLLAVHLVGSLPV